MQKTFVVLDVRHLEHYFFRFLCYCEQRILKVEAFLSEELVHQ